ncbi:MAG TPA: ATP-binding protein [Opitutaceae bacterium]|nr:ATP-binding protein [Opitutaceae bacterium]
MTDYLTLQADYLLLVQGVVLSMLVSPVLALARLEPERPWRCLASFALLGAAHDWLTILALDAGDSPAFATARQALFAASFACLALMADRGTRFQAIPLLRVLRWTALALFMVLALWLGSWALPALSTAFGIWAASTLWQWSRAHPHQPQPWLRNTSMALAGFAICDGLTQTFGSLTGTPAGGTDTLPLLCSLLLACATAFSALLYHQKRRHAQLLRAMHARAYLRPLAWTSALALTLALGWAATSYVSQHTHRTLRNDILIRAQLAAAAIAPDLIRQLAWSPADQSHPAYDSIKQTLQAIVLANPDLRFAMLMGTRDSTVLFLADSEAPDSADYSPPGQPYDEAPQDYLQQLAAGKPFVLGPISDRWGRWVTASIPLLSLPDGRRIHFDLDIAAADWDGHLRNARLPVLLITLLFAMLLLTFGRMQERVRDSLESLSISEQLHSSLIEGSPDCIQMLDRNGAFLTINRHGLAALGYADPTQLIGRPFLDLWPPASKPAIAQALERTWQGHPTTTEADYTRPDGSTRTWLLSTNPLHESSGHIARLVALCTDITDRKHAEQASLAAKEAAEASTKAKSEFFAVMSHEIRTPLGGVIGLLDLLRKRPLSPDDRYHAEVAHKSALHLLGLLDDILDAAKLEAGKLTLEAIPFSPRSELQALIESMRLHTEAKKLRLSLDIAPDVPQSLIGDPTRLRQIVTNLLSNALKFTERGSISTRLTLRHIQGHIAHLELSVADTGIGIPHDTQRRLFSKFEQADVSTTRRFGGTGLGLSIIRSLTLLMGGTITLQSTPGAGTTFTVSLPLAIDVSQPPAPAQPATPTPLATHPAQLHLLCAEDDATNRLVIQTHLSDMGHRVTFAENGWLAIDLLRGQSFDAILMDNRMPVMDGFEATRMIRDTESGVLDHQIYIIACTANTSDDYRQRCLAAGMHDFLPKPIRDTELHAAIDRAIAYQRDRGCTLSPMPGQAPLPVGLSEAELLAQFDAATAAPSANPLDGLSPRASHEIHQRFHADLPVRLLEIHTAIALDDAPTLARAAHTLKSSARYIHADQLSSLAARIESLADAGHLSDIPPILHQLEDEIPRLSPNSPADSRA